MADNDVWSWKSTQHDTTQPPSKRMSEKSRVSHHHQKESSKKSKTQWDDLSRGEFSPRRRLFCPATSLNLNFHSGAPQLFTDSLSALHRALLRSCCCVYSRSIVASRACDRVYDAPSRLVSAKFPLSAPMSMSWKHLHTSFGRRSTYNHRASTHARDHLTSVKRAPVKPIRDRTNRVFLSFFRFLSIYAIEEKYEKKRDSFFFLQK